MRRSGLAGWLYAAQRRGRGRLIRGRRGRRSAGRSLVQALLECGEQLGRLVDRNGESDPYVAVNRALDGVVDADHLALGVQKRTTRVTRVDRCVGLDEMGEAGTAGGRIGSVEGGNHPCA